MSQHDLITLKDSPQPLIIIDEYRNKIKSFIDEIKQNDSQDDELLSLLNESGDNNEERLDNRYLPALELSLVLLDRVSNNYK